MSARAPRVSRARLPSAAEKTAARRVERRLLCERKGSGRAKNFFYLTLVLAGALALRLTYLQVVRGPQLAHMATQQHTETVEIFARRGTIYDRDRGILARSSPSESVYVDPHFVTDAAGEAKRLSPLVGITVAELTDTFSAKSRFQWVKRKIPPEQAKKIKALQLAGVQVLDEDSGLRTNPSGRLASHVLGIVNIDEQGIDGLEYEFNSMLRGTSGKKTIEVGENSGPIPFGRTNIEGEAKPGRSLVLTLDSYIQYVTEHALREGVKAYSARSGSAIVMDPWTGEVLAMANVPDYDPNSFGNSTDDSRRNRAVTDAYEPGSTFKLITAAAALESGVSADERFPALDALDVGGAVIHNAEDGMMAGGHGSESMEDIIAYSHNVGAAEIGMRAGTRKLAQMIDKFGFGHDTNIELPGDGPGIVSKPADWSGSSLATISFGHGISVTTLALANAYATIANGGLLMRPRILSEILSPDGELVYHYKPAIEHRVISPKTAATLQRYLRAVVTRGTGNPTAQVAGFTTAGKTGTAQVEENGYYASGQYIASFAGYIPANKPRFVIVVKVERPKGSIYGSQVAAPIFTKIARAAMIHAGYLPANGAGDGSRKE